MKGLWQRQFLKGKGIKDSFSLLNNDISFNNASIVSKCLLENPENMSEGTEVRVNFYAM